MILALAYVFLSAKPISIRRLFLLYIFSFSAACCLFTILQTEHAAKLAWQFAIVVTLAAWAYPLFHVLHGAFRRRVWLEAFERVSISVQATYGFALAIALMAGVETFAAPAGVRSLGSLSRTVVTGFTGGIGFALLASALRYGCNRHDSIARLPSKCS